MASDHVVDELVVLRFFTKGEPYLFGFQIASKLRRKNFTGKMVERLIGKGLIEINRYHENKPIYQITYKGEQLIKKS